MRQSLSNPSGQHGVLGQVGLGCRGDSSGHDHACCWQFLCLTHGCLVCVWRLSAAFSRVLWQHRYVVFNGFAETVMPCVVR